MSWLFSQALVEEYLAGTCSDGEPCVPLSGNPIPQAYCALDKMTKFSRLSRFGMTFKPLTESLGEGLLTWYLADFHAKTSVQQDEAPESTESGAECGGTWRESLGRYDPSTHTLKTAQCSLFEDLMSSSPTLPRWGSMRNGELFRRQTLVRLTDETGSGLWPTPTSTLVTNGGLVTPSKGREGGTLIEALSARTLWPTPTASDNRPRGTPHTTARRMKLGKQVGLEAMVKWLTPTVEDAGRAGSADAWRQYEQTGKTTGARLRNQVAGRQWLTPTAHNAKETNAPSESNLHTPTLAAQAGGALNPTWVEWLMGWPLGWTDLKPLEMGKYQQWLQQHGVY